VASPFREQQILRSAGAGDDDPLMAFQVPVKRIHAHVRRDELATLTAGQVLIAIATEQGQASGDEMTIARGAEITDRRKHLNIVHPASLAKTELGRQVHLRATLAVHAQTDMRRRQTCSDREAHSARPAAQRRFGPNSGAR
jgi:hypothetical protein